jgi:hypothetical protein
MNEMDYGEDDLDSRDRGQDEPTVLPSLDPLHMEEVRSTCGWCVWSRFVEMDIKLGFSMHLHHSIKIGTFFLCLRGLWPLASFELRFTGILVEW